MKARDLNEGDVFRFANETVGCLYMAAEKSLTDVRAVNLTLRGWDTFIHIDRDVTIESGKERMEEDGKGTDWCIAVMNSGVERNGEEGRRMDGMGPGGSGLEGKESEVKGWERKGLVNQERKTCKQTTQKSKKRSGLSAQSRALNTKTPWHHQ